MKKTIAQAWTKSQDGKGKDPKEGGKFDSIDDYWWLYNYQLIHNLHMYEAIFMCNHRSQYSIHSVKQTCFLWFNSEGALESYCLSLFTMLLAAFISFVSNSSGTSSPLSLNIWSFPVFTQTTKDISKSACACSKLEGSTRIYFWKTCMNEMLIKLTWESFKSRMSGMSVWPFSFSFF